MPKINIYDENVQNFRVEVGWAADKYVQVGTTNSDSHLTLDGEPFSGWHVTLDRNGINRAIRALREARDAAFEPDA